MTLQRCLASAFVVAVALLLKGVSAETGGLTMQAIHFEPTLENGDWNGDERRDITDLLSLVTCLYIGGVPPVPCECYHPDAGGVVSNLLGMHCDMNGDGMVNLTDAIHYGNWLFANGPLPVELECEQPFEPSQ